MYPIGFLFGLGFDTSSEVALLAISAATAAQQLPLIAVLVLPIIFASGMSLMDTADGAFMAKAYLWAFSNPIRKVFYNLTMTSLSVFVALFVGLIGEAAADSERTARPDRWILDCGGQGELQRDGVHYRDGLRAHVAQRVGHLENSPHRGTLRGTLVDAESQRAADPGEFPLEFPPHIRVEGSGVTCIGRLIKIQLVKSVLRKALVSLVRPDCIALVTEHPAWESAP